MHFHDNKTHVTCFYPNCNPCGRCFKANLPCVWSFFLLFQNFYRRFAVHGNHTLTCQLNPHPPLVARIHPNTTERDLGQKSPNPKLKWHHETCAILTDNILLIRTLNNNLLEVTEHGKCIVIHSSKKLRVMKIAVFFFLSDWKKKTLFRQNF